jgi:hypothetical protein
MEQRSAWQHAVNAADRARSPRPSDRTACARGRRADRRRALGCGCAFLVLMSLLDRCAGTLTLPRALAWTAGACVVFAVLLPPRITAERGRLVVRGALRTRRVRLDALVGIRRIGDVTVTLILYDAYGGRVQLPPAVLESDPVLWHTVDTGIHRSRQRGTLRTGRRLAAEISDRIDARAADVLRASGLD